MNEQRFAAGTHASEVQRKEDESEFHDAEMTSRFGIVPAARLFAFLRSLAAALSRLLFSFTAFMSFGAVVRSCLICVGISSRVGGSRTDGGCSHAALMIGTDSSSE